MEKSQVIKLALNITILASLASCASYHPMESVTEKMDRYHPRKDGPQPSYGLTVNSTQVRTGRGPASASSIVPKLNYNNKQLYFMTLLDQYNRLGQFASSPINSIQHCPANHSALITYQEKYSSHWPKKAMPKLPQTEGQFEKYPELQLSVSLDSAYPVVADIVKKQGKEHADALVQKALDAHLVKTYNELRSLCDTGASDNYYAFENLLSEVKKSDSVEPNAIMKGPVFSNMALLKSLSRNTGRSIASGEQETLGKETLARAKAGWVLDYLKQLNK